MKFALLGADPAMLSVARAAAEAGYGMSLAIECAAAADYLRALFPEIQFRDDWESLLAPGTVDGVLVARGANEDLRADQLRKLVQEAVPLLVSHPVSESMLLYYELDMIRRESGGRMMPYLPARWSPSIARLRELTADPAAGIGTLEQVAIERSLVDRSRTAVISQFATDADLARLLVGELTHLSALAPGEDAARYGSLGLQLSGPHNIAVRWSARAANVQAGTVVQLHGTQGRAELSSDGDGETVLDLWRGEQKTTQTFAPGDPAKLALEAFVQLAPAPTWIDACRAVELAETIDRSLKRGRTIELHYEDYSEQGTFKGMMTSLGCGLLVAALFIMLLAALAGRLGLPLAEHWVTLLIVLFAGFLGLQALRLVFPSQR